MKVVYRQGKKGDCLRIAEYMYLASEGLMEFLFEGLTGDKLIAEYVADALAEDNGLFSYRSAIVAEWNGRQVGTAFCYPGSEYGMTPEMREFFPAERLQCLEELLESCARDSLYLDSIFVEQGFRSQGVGKGLIEECKARARREGLPAISLHVRENNDDARRFYRRLGFKEVETIRTCDGGGLLDEGEYILMVGPTDPLQQTADGVRRSPLWKRLLRSVGVKV